MGLIIHPSSCCDVCLEFFTYDEPKPPHAIPCGHIFCKDCLHTVNPRNCPLCRKAFVPERSKKLITGELPTPEGVNEINLLKKLALSWDLQEEQLVEVTTEVETWLLAREESPTTLPLRKAWEALRTYHRLRMRTNDDRLTIRQLKQEIRATIDEKNTANAVEQSLIAQIEEFHTKVFRYEAEIQKLRAELAKFRYTTNPLPAPPEPVSLDRVPALVQSAAAGPSSYLWPPTDSANVSDESVHRNYLSEGEDSHFLSRETQRVRDRKGKGKARDDKDRPPPGIYRTPELIQPNLATLNGATTAIINGSGNRNAIIPGATPNQRVIPMRETAFEDLATQTVTRELTPPELKGRPPLDPNDFFSPYILTAEFVSGYPDGYVAGYQAALNPSTGEGNHPNNYSTWGPVQSSLLDRPPGPHNQSSRKLQPHPRWMAEGNHPGYPPGSYRSVPPLSAPPRTNSRPAQDAVGEHTRVQRISSPLSAPIPTTIAPRPAVANGQRLGWEERSRSASHYVQPTPPATSSSTTSTQRHEIMDENVRPRNHRRRTVQVDDNLAEPEVQASDPSIVHVSQLRRRSAMSVQHNDIAPTSGTAAIVDDRSSLDARNSILSWGTVDSENPPISVSDLPIHTDFSLGARGSIHSLSSFHPYVPSLNGMRRANEEVSVDRTADIATPRGRVASFSESVSTVRPMSTSSHGTERPRDRRVASNFSTQPMPVSRENIRRFAVSPVQEQTADAALSYRTNATDYSSFGRLPASTLVDDSSENDNSVEATLWTDAGHLTNDPQSLAGNALGLRLSRSPDNALGLLLNQSPQISAPTPIVPSRAFLQSFSHQGYY